MKVLWQKIKRINKPCLIIFIFSLIFFSISYCLFVKSLLSLVGVETTIRLILIFLFFCWLIFYLLYGIVNLILKKYIKFSILSFINVILAVILIVISLLVNKIYSKIDAFSEDEYITYTTNLITLANKELDNNGKLGIISNKDDIEGNVLAFKIIDKYKLKQEIIYFDDYYEMLDALYKEEITGAFLTNNYVSIFASEENYSNISKDTKVVYEYSEKMKNKTITNTNKKLTEPFTVLLMGVDSEIDGLNANAAFNGDTLMLITFNPKTLTATMFSIPRDTYVPIACNNNKYNKINSSAAYGTSCVISTIQNLTGIEINYFAKINFNGVIDLVNALGGIDVDVEAPDYKFYIQVHGEGRLCESNSYRDTTNLVCMNTGWQHLNGEQALAYARNRHGFLESDIARNRHQQQILEAMAKKLLQLQNFSDMEKIFDSVSKNIATNLQTNQILSLYQTLKNMLLNSLKGNDFIKIQKAYLEYYNLRVLIPAYNAYVSAIGYYQGSLDEITKAMRINLELESEQPIKTFSYDYQELYEAKVIGKNIKTGERLTTIPNFTGKTVNEALEWGLNNNIIINKEFMCSSNLPGLIGNQSTPEGALTKSIQELTIYINQNCQSENNQTNGSENNEEENPPTTEVEPIPGMPNKEENEDNNSENNENIENVDPTENHPEENTENDDNSNIIADKEEGE